MVDRVSLTVAFLLLMLTGATSCIFEDRDGCVLSVGFSYAYNVKDADAFSPEVRDIELYVFDFEGIFKEKYSDRGPAFPESYRMKVTSLPPGTYTFVALGRNGTPESLSGEFRFSVLEPGRSSLGDLTMLLDVENGVSDKRIASLYNGVTRVELKDGRQSVDVGVRKLTNDFRIILMPINEEKSLDGDAFDFRIEEKSSWLDYKGDKYEDRPILHLPHFQESTGAVIADIKTSRLIYEDRPTLVISRSGTGDELLRLNLAWFLSLHGISEHRGRWSNQEYLDRQDAYTITFFVDGDAFLLSRIVVNGWVMSLSDVHLD